MKLIIHTADTIAIILHNREIHDSSSAKYSDKYFKSTSQEISVMCFFSADELADGRTLGSCTFDGINGKIELLSTQKVRRNLHHVGIDGIFLKNKKQIL